MKPKSRITKITIGRLYNLGNYEHIRYEIEAEIPNGASVKQTFLDCGEIIARLKPIKLPYEYDKAKEALQKIPEQLTEYEKGQMENYIRVVQEVETARALRLEALARLDAIGGTSKRTDAKANWDNDDCPF